MPGAFPDARSGVISNSPCTPCLSNPAGICLTATGVAADFVHPGVAHDSERLAFVRARVEAGQQPWTEAWEKLRASREASLSWPPRPRAHVERGAYNNPNIGSSDFSNDGTAAYIHALCWILTDNVAHARKSAEIVDAWSGTLQSISNHDARLLVGMSGYPFTIAAELLKHTWDGRAWTRRSPGRRWSGCARAAGTTDDVEAGRMRRWKP